MSESKVLLSARGVFKNYKRGDQSLEILKGVDLDVERGDALCIVGASGAGKSTLLQILGTLDRPTRGDVEFQGQKLSEMSDEKLAQFRGENMGFVFQFHHLLPEFSALENIMMPRCISGASQAQARLEAEELLRQFGLSDRADHFPSELSGGEQQRIAIARAIANKPQVLFADEPTGNLDSKNSQSIQDLFFELKERMGVTLIVVTHDRSYASRFQKRLEMVDGLLEPLREN